MLVSLVSQFFNAMLIILGTPQSPDRFINFDGLRKDLKLIFKIEIA